MHKIWRRPAWPVMRYLALVAGGLMLMAIGASPAGAQNTPKLVAPAYTGATSLGCSSGDISASCVFGTKDSLDKVKAFYEKSVGGLHEAKDGYVMVLRSGKAVEGEGTFYTVFATVQIQSRPAVNLPPAGDQKAHVAAGQLKYVRVLSELVGWTDGTRQMKPEELKATGFRTTDEFYKVFQQYRHLESAYYPKDQADEAKNRYDTKTAAIRKKFEQAGEQSASRSQSAFDQMRKDQAKQRQDMERQRAEDCKRGPTAQQKADHEELKRIIKKNSEERYKRFMAVSARMEKSGCATPGPTMDFNSPAMKDAMEMGKIMQEDPEAMAWAEKMQKREEASRPKNTSGDAFVKSTQGSAALLPQQSNEMWQAGLEYLAALDKIYVRTRIAISGEKFGADGGGIVTDRKVVEDQWAKRKVKSDTDSEDEDDSVAGNSAGGPSAQGKKAAASTGGSKQEKKEEKKSATDDATETAKKAGQEGLKMLKKLF